MEDRPGKKLPKRFQLSEAQTQVAELMWIESMYFNPKEKQKGKGAGGRRDGKSQQGGDGKSIEHPMQTTKYSTELEYALKAIKRKRKVPSNIILSEEQEQQGEEGMEEVGTHRAKRMRNDWTRAQSGGAGRLPRFLFHAAKSSKVISWNNNSSQGTKSRKPDDTRKICQDDEKVNGQAQSTDLLYPRSGQDRGSIPACPRPQGHDHVEFQNPGIQKNWHDQSQHGLRRETLRSSLVEMLPCIQTPSINNDHEPSEELLPGSAQQPQGLAKHDWKVPVRSPTTRGRYIYPPLDREAIQNVDPRINEERDHKGTSRYYKVAVDDDLRDNSRFCPKTRAPIFSDAACRESAIPIRPPPNSPDKPAYLPDPFLISMISLDRSGFSFQPRPRK